MEINDFNYKVSTPQDLFMLYFRSVPSHSYDIYFQNVIYTSAQSAFDIDNLVKPFKELVSDPTVIPSE